MVSTQALNLVLSPLLFLVSGGHTIHHTLLDMFSETAYGCWAMYVAAEQARFRDLPAPVLVPSTLSGFARGATQSCSTSLQYVLDDRLRV